MTISVLIADDQDLVRAGLAMILDAQPDIDVVAQASNGREAVELAETLEPPLVLHAHEQHRRLGDVDVVAGAEDVVERA